MHPRPVDADGLRVEHGVAGAAPADLDVVAGLQLHEGVEGDLGVNSIEILHFGCKTGQQTGPCSGPNSVLEHSKFRHV